MESLITTTAVIVGAILLYRYRAPLIAALRRFDARNVERIREEIMDRRDPVAHFKHTFRTAEEQVEEIGEIELLDPRTGEPVKRFLFEGEQFANREDAEAARRQSITGKARQFYQELPAALTHRRKETLH